MNLLIAYAVTKTKDAIKTQKWRKNTSISKIMWWIWKIKNGKTSTHFAVSLLMIELTYFLKVHNGVRAWMVNMILKLASNAKHMQQFSIKNNDTQISS